MVARLLRDPTLPPPTCDRPGGAPDVYHYAQAVGDCGVLNPERPVAVPTTWDTFEVKSASLSGLCKETNFAYAYTGGPGARHA